MVRILAKGTRFVVDHATLRVAILMLALVVSGCMTGAGVYEQLVLDTAWPRTPSIVRPLEGGANRKLFWVPVNIVAILALLIALWAAYPVTAARNAVLIAISLFAIINAATVGYFAPAVLRVERDSVLPDAASSLQWVRLSRLRTVLALGVNTALAFAAALVAQTAGAAAPVAAAVWCHASYPAA
jgi:hypothetical protein